MPRNPRHRNEQRATGVTIATNDTASARQNGGLPLRVCKGRESRQMTHGQPPLPPPDTGTRGLQGRRQHSLPGTRGRRLGATATTAQLTLFLHSAQGSEQTALQLDNSCAKDTCACPTRQLSCSPAKRGKPIPSRQNSCSSLRRAKWVFFVFFLKKALQLTLLASEEMWAVIRATSKQNQIMTDTVTVAHVTATCT